MQWERMAQREMAEQIEREQRAQREEAERMEQEQRAQRESASRRARKVATAQNVAAAATLLGVDPGANVANVKRAYRLHALRTHPDKMGGDDTEFKRVRDAYNILSEATRDGRNVPIQSKSGKPWDHWDKSQWEKYQKAQNETFDAFVNDVLQGAKRLAGVVGLLVVTTFAGADGRFPDILGLPDVAALPSIQFPPGVKDRAGRDIGEGDIVFVFRDLPDHPVLVAYEDKQSHYTSTEHMRHLSHAMERHSIRGSKAGGTLYVVVRPEDHTAAAAPSDARGANSANG